MRWPWSADVNAGDRLTPLTLGYVRDVMYPGLRALSGRHKVSLDFIVDHKNGTVSVVVGQHVLVRQDELDAGLTCHEIAERLTTLCEKIAEKTPRAA